MSSSEFRRRYASLTKPTRVMVKGRPIGQWVPQSRDPDVVHLVTEARTVPASQRQTAQMARDAILGKINKGK
jgi:hypothetical protein